MNEELTNQVAEPVSVEQMQEDIKSINKLLTGGGYLEDAEFSTFSQKFSLSATVILDRYGIKYPKGFHPEDMVTAPDYLSRLWKDLNAKVSVDSKPQNL